MRSFLAGSVLVALGAAGCGKVVPATADGPGEAPADCDADRDTFIHPHPSCDPERAGAPADCDDNRAEVHPGAALVCGDGAINDCSVLAPDVVATLGIEEIGKVSEQAVYLTAPDGFLNNVAIAAVAATATAPAITLMASGETATTVRLVRSEIGNPASATTIPVDFPAGLRFANHNVELIRRGDGSYLIATVALDGQNRLTPVFGAFAATDASVTLRATQLPTGCPTGTNDHPVVLHGLDDNGQLYFELVAGSPAAIHGVAANLTTGLCKPLAPVAAELPFGSQIVATGGMAVGRTATGMWIWEMPLNYDDLHPYTTSGRPSGVHTALARDTQSGDPVLLAYESEGSLIVEAIQCTGLTPCTRIAAAPVAGVSTGIRDLAFTSIASGAALFQTRGGFSGPQELVAQLFDASGAILGAGVTIPVGGTTREFRQLDVFTTPPGVGRAYYDMFVGYAAADSLAMQTEMRVINVRGCQAK